MKPIAAIAAFAGAANGFVARGGNCCFELTGNGVVSGIVGQLGDGQNRVGGNQPAGTYCIDSNGGLTDSQGRGCILTGPTTQFQCDVGATPQGGFSVGCDGTLWYNGSPNFYECDAGDGNGDNIYTSVSSAQSNCHGLTLTANNCKSGCPAPPPPPPPPPPPKTCPADLSGTYEFPHLIVPVSCTNPDTAYGTKYNGLITPDDISSIFNFDIPSSDAGKTCSLVFLLPYQWQLQTSSFTISGDGNIDFSCLSGPASLSTTYDNQPGVASDLGTFTVAPGNSYLISTFLCPAGQTVAYKLSSGSTSLDYFQDYNPSPIGLYITVC